MQTMNMNGRVALVTGASQGIGEGIARALHASGAKVALLARNAARLQGVTDSLGNTAFAAVGDVTDAASLARAVAAAEEALGPIDILVNNAGGLHSTTGELFRPFEQVPDEDWVGTWELNVLSAVRTSRLLAPGMAARGWGRIINISSESGSQPDPVAIEYASAKGALNLFSKGLSKAYADRGVLVNVVSPAFVDTPILRAILAQQEGAADVAGDDLAQHYLAAFRPNIGIGRPCTPEDVAAAVLFLASNAAGFVTGIDLRVDGGSVSTL
jgi:NAD(P)-dependent dehydrogenase (short-subunit alcohol dehydrogenase family)